MELKEILEVINRDFKGKAIDDKGNCEYLSKDGRKCAIGLFIPEGHDASSRGLDVKRLLLEYPDLMEFMPSGDLETLDAFQRGHDHGLHSGMDLKEQKEKLCKRATVLFK